MKFLTSQKTMPLRPKIVITGTGRAGTTFLVRLFTELGEDTGFTPENWSRGYDAHCAAGLEHDDITAPDTPRIVKNPALCELLPALLARQAIAIEHALVPVRGLEAAARSRVWVGGRGTTPGGLWGTDDPAAQKAVLAEKFHDLVQTLVEHEVPLTFLAFPRFVRDVDYAWGKLHPILRKPDRAAFDAAFRRVARPELVHDFSTGLPEGAGRAAREYEERKRLRRARWRRRRLYAAIAVLATLCGTGWLFT